MGKMMGRFITAGHGMMGDFLDNLELQQITQNIYANGELVSNVCHGYGANPFSTGITAEAIIGALNSQQILYLVAWATNKY